MPPERPEVLLPFLPDFFFFLGSSAAALDEQHPAALSLLHVAPLASVLAEAPLLQQPAALSLLHVAPLASVLAEAPLLQQPAALSLLHVDLLASFEQVCSVLAFFSAGASVDCAEAVNANRANAPRKRNFFMCCVLIQFQVCQTASVNQDTNSFNFPRSQ